MLYVHFLSHFFILPSQFAHKVLRLLFCTFLLLLEYHTILSNKTLNNSENSTQLINNLLTCHVTCRIPHYSFYCQAGHSIIDKLHTLKLSYVEISIENFWCNNEKTTVAKSAYFSSSDSFPLLCFNIPFLCTVLCVPTFLCLFIYIVKSLCILRQ